MAHVPLDRGDHARNSHAEVHAKGDPDGRIERGHRHCERESARDANRHALDPEFRRTEAPILDQRRDREGEQNDDDRSGVFDRGRAQGPEVAAQMHAERAGPPVVEPGERS